VERLVPNAANPKPQGLTPFHGLVDPFMKASGIASLIGADCRQKTNNSPPTLII
jgi:hypothetical protein